MRRFLLVLFACVTATTMAFAQSSVSGKVTADDGSPIEGAAVVVKGTTIGTFTGSDGSFTLEVPAGAKNLIVTFVGMGTKDVEVTGSNMMITLTDQGFMLDEVVVTALGITRDKKSLGYATQEVGGEEVTRVKDVNFMNSLSGKIAGVSVGRSNQMGGSANVIVRGYTSLTGNNQALFVVDGIIMSNDITNASGQNTGRGGFDYGNAAMDINP
ncbi:MAG: carboxypeptidase-like regulatory domain-containing protein, partial [Bacteroidia bacterium]|nr:carboxypeptidase-like regulatory domain-containing protein [Bacteroidia bacterium]